MLAVERRRQRRAAAHGIADVGDHATRLLVLGQVQQDAQRAVQRLARAQQRGQLLGELHQAVAAERMGTPQLRPAATGTGHRRHRFHRQVSLLLQPRHDIGVAGGLHLAFQHLAMRVEGLVTIERHADGNGENAPTYRIRRGIVMRGPCRRLGPGIPGPRSRTPAQGAV